VNKNLKKRIITSVLLLLLMTAMFLKNEMLMLILLLGCIFSFIEFSRMIKIINQNKKITQLIYNLVFIFYLFLFSAFFVITSFYLNLKIIIFSILIICICSDMGGIIFGKYFKGPKLIKISPNKTISGSIGSFFLAIIASIILFYYLTDKFDISFIFIGVGISLAVQAGDLIFSYLKRKSKLKDTGNILPGHGGILDRVDGILLGLPIGFIFIIFIL
tara:strand:+ start:4733 stop:5383 length:651 start_codon:yes stop_codon:yes gene_type:complete